MKRDLDTLSAREHDLVVIGGGVYGCAIARDAALRGLTVALVERRDFGGATSGNSHRIIHSGLRYLQHGDIPRLRESLREMRTLRRIAPHLVHPLPVIVPTYGHGLRGKEILSLAVVLHRLLGTGTGSAGVPQELLLPDGPMSRDRVLAQLPGLSERGLTGGVVFHDSQVENSERLLLGYLQSAAGAGAALANYVEATSFLVKRGRVEGIEALDVASGTRLEVRGHVVVNAAGPWTTSLLASGPWRGRKVTLVRALNLVTREVFADVAVGLYGRASHDDAAALVRRGQRLYFFAPWKGHTIAGTSYRAHDLDPDALVVTRAEIEELLAELNSAYPPAKLTIADVRLLHYGLQSSAGVSRRSGEIQVATQFSIHDHARDGVEGLLSVDGVKLTTARDVAERVVDRVTARVPGSWPRSHSARAPLPGAIECSFAEFLRDAVKNRPPGVSAASAERLARSHGTTWKSLLAYADPPNAPAAPLDELAILRAEVRHGIREEMALTLDDLLLRRSDVGCAGHPGQQAVAAAAETAEKELGWTPQRTAREIAAVESRYRIPD